MDNAKHTEMNRSLYRAISEHARSGVIKCIPKAGGGIKYLVLTEAASGELNSLGVRTVSLASFARDPAYDYGRFSTLVDYSAIRSQLGNPEQEQALRSSIPVLEATRMRSITP